MPSTTDPRRWRGGHRVAGLRSRVGARVEARRFVREVRASGVFDEAWYRSQLAKVDPGRDVVAHYVREGARHGLSPSPLFDPQWYMRSVKGAGESRLGPFAHYLRSGITCRASPHPIVDVPHYLRHHPRALEHRAGVLGHYLEDGWRQGLEVNRWFDSRAYARWRPDYKGDEPAVVHFLRWATPWLLQDLGPDSGGAAGAVRHGADDANFIGQPIRLALRERAAQLIDWRSVADSPGVPERTSIIVVASSSAHQVERCVAAIWSTARGVDIEVVVADNTLAIGDAYRLLSLEARHPGTRVVRLPWERLHSAIPTNYGIASATGDVIVLLDPSVIVQPGWLEPLARPVRGGEVVGTQPLILTQAGSVRSAGYTVSPHGRPYEALHGFPEHAEVVGQAANRVALSGGCLAVRYRDIVAVEGLDPMFLQFFGDVDLCRRLAESRHLPLRFEPASTVVQADQAEPAAPHILEHDAQLFEERWAGCLPTDEATVLFAAGVRRSPHQRDAPNAVGYTPVLVGIEDRARPLRWAIKVAAPSVHRRLRWGDWHFAMALRDALRRIGHEVVVDLHPAWNRPTAHLDDIVVVLRGLEPYQPRPEQVNLFWLISHPDLVTDEEVRGFDRLFVASNAFAAKLSDRARRPVESLPQCTDPARFSPGPATSKPGHKVLFVGNSRGQLRPIVADALAAGLPLSVYGARWERFLPPGVVVDGYLPNERLGAAYRNAGVVLCDHWDDMRREGFLSNRLFDLAACGAAVVCDEVAGIEETFAGLIRTYSHPDALSTVVQEVLGRRDEEAAARLDLAARVAVDHSFDARAARLSEVATDVRLGGSCG